MPHESIFFKLNEMDIVVQVTTSNNYFKKKKKKTAIFPYVFVASPKQAR
jgi:hypothetical protein